MDPNPRDDFGGDDYSGAAVPEMSAGYAGGGGGSGGGGGISAGGGGGGGRGGGGGGGGGSDVREQDRFLPIANISRIMKKALPNSAKLAKDAKEGVQECVSEFISFVTSEGARACARRRRPLSCGVVFGGA